MRRGRALAAAVLALASTAAAQQQVQPTITLTPDCIDTRPRAWTITATGRMPYPGVTVYVQFDYGGSNPRTSTGSVNNSYQYSVTLSVPTASYTGTSWRVAAFQTEPDGGIVAFAETLFRSPCTTSTTTPSSSSSSSSSTSSSSSSSSSSTSSSTTSTSTTTTTTVAPSRVPVLAITPAVGPPGFVAIATGAGFPPGPVTLDWDRGIGGAAAVADASGTFSVPVPVLRKDVLGPRTLTAVGGAATASTTFLVVPASMQPDRFVFRG
ncbi:MAG TPA: hypothetical protein VHF47_14405 [Acidimicrobiales bacterium]|nr:hypothetical protein [Acidimicrobiales bacterium]